MSDPADLRQSENWRGGHYGLVIQLGEPDKWRLHDAVVELWKSAAVEGCFTRKGLQPASLGELDLSRGCQLCGVVRLPGGARVVYALVGAHWDSGTDWLYFSLPVGALQKTDPRIGGFGFADEGSLAWRKPIDDWLAGIAQAIYSVAPFRAGWIGMEPVSVAGEIVPDERWVGYLVRESGRLLYAPANR